MSTKKMETNFREANCQEIPTKMIELSKIVTLMNFSRLQRENFTFRNPRSQH